jgi:hypothetical protein
MPHHSLSVAGALDHASGLDQRQAGMLQFDEQAIDRDCFGIEAAEAAVEFPMPGRLVEAGMHFGKVTPPGRRNRDFWCPLSFSGNAMALANSVISAKRPPSPSYWR